MKYELRIIRFCGGRCVCECEMHGRMKEFFHLEMSKVISASLVMHAFGKLENNGASRIRIMRRWRSMLGSEIARQQCASESSNHKLVYDYL